MCFFGGGSSYIRIILHSVKYGKSHTRQPQHFSLWIVNYYIIKKKVTHYLNSFWKLKITDL